MGPLSEVSGRLLEIIPRTAGPQITVSGIRTVKTCTVIGSNHGCKFSLYVFGSKPLVTRIPYGYRRVISEATHHIAGIFEKQIIVVHFKIITGGTEPEVIEYQHAVFVAQLIKHFFRALAGPITYHIEISIFMQAEVWLKTLPRHPLHSVIHAPVAATAEYTLAVDLYDQIMTHQAVRRRHQHITSRIFHNAGHAHALLHVLSVDVIKHRLSVGNR